MPMAKDLEYYLAQARRIAEHREVGAERELRKLYKAMLKDLQQFLSETYIQYAEDDKLTYAMLQKAGYDARFLEEVEQRLNLSTPAAAKQLHELVEETYRAAYEAMVDGVRRVADGETLDAAFAETVAITPEQIKAAVENPVSGLKLSDTLEKNRREIIYSIKQSVGIGLMIGARYTTIARRIAEQVDGDYKKAVRIARTEAHRVREAGNHDAAMGVDRALQNGTTGWRMVKRWKTMQDERVRPQRRRKGKKGWYTVMGRGANHMKLDGQTVLEDEPFDLGGGVTAMAPGQSGVAGHDINCRCYASREMMDDAEFFEKTGRHFPRNNIGQSAGNGEISLKPGEVRQIGTVDFQDEKAVLVALEQVERGLSNLDYEVNVTVTSDGRVWYVKGDNIQVNPWSIQDAGSTLRGSYSYHNHPSAKTHYSFSAADVRFFFQSGAAYSKASDQLYEYVMRRTADTIDNADESAYNRFKEIEKTEVFEMKWRKIIDPDLDEYHEVMKLLSHELGIEYERKKKGKNR